MFEVARCFYKTLYSDFSEYRDGNFIIHNFRNGRIIKIMKGHCGLVLFEEKITSMETVMKDGMINIVDFVIKKLPESIHEYSDEELLLILGGKYTDEYIFDAIRYNDIKQNILLNNIKEFNTNV